MHFLVLYATAPGDYERKIRSEFLAQVLRERGHEVITRRMRLWDPEFIETLNDDPKGDAPHPMMIPLTFAGTGGVVFRDLGDSPKTSWWRFPGPCPGKIFYSIAYEDYGPGSKYANVQLRLRKREKDVNVGLHWAIVPRKTTNELVNGDWFQSIDARCRWEKDWEIFAKQISHAKRVICNRGTGLYYALLNRKQISYRPDSFRDWLWWVTSFKSDLRDLLEPEGVPGWKRVVELMESLGRRAEDMEAKRSGKPALKVLQK